MAELSFWKMLRLFCPGTRFRGISFQCGKVTFGQAELPGAQQAAHDLARPRAGQCVAEDDLARGDGGAKAFARMAAEFALQHLSRFEPDLQGDEGLDHFARGFIRDAKLTVVSPAKPEEIVPKISEYANTQNKVNAADFFANHPFHIRMEQFSRDVIFTARDGERHDSKWFYERSRGQFINARPKVKGKTQASFDIEFPKAQLFSKTDLAKFEFSAAGQPHIVSRGAQKNFAEFAKEIGEAWAKSDARYDELWYRRLISKAIIFRWLETEVPKQPWYEGGYRANIVTYSMAKLFHDANGEKQVLDLDAIWRRQSVPEALQRALLLAAAEAHDVVTHPPAGVRNMSEWAKQQACWNGMKGRTLDYDDDFETCLILVETARTAKRDEKAKKAMTEGINAQSEVVTLGADFWKVLLAWGRERKRLTPKDQQILEVCASIPRRLPSDLQSRHALDALARMRDQGFGDG